MPIYYATGSKMRAFGWATLSGMSEPLGALFGYCVLGGDVGNVAYGAMFGIVAGMMVYISLAELLPSAHRFDSNGGVIMGSMVALLLPPLFASSLPSSPPPASPLNLRMQPSRLCFHLVIVGSPLTPLTTCAHVLLPRRRLWPRVTRLSLVSLSVMVCGQVAGMAIMAVSLMAFQL